MRDPLALAERAVSLTAAAAAIFFFCVSLTHAGALWRDEMNSVNTAAAPTLADMWRLIEYESFPMGWLLALRGWMGMGLGGSDFTLRLFGVLGGLALPAAIWFALRRLTRAAPLASLALVAVNPELIRWSGSVRAWGAGAALAIVVMVLVREASVTLTPRRFIFAAIASVLAVQVTYQNAIVLGGIVAAAAIVAGVRRRWAEALVPIGIGGIAALSLLPYAGPLGRRAAWNGLGATPVLLGDLAGKAWEVATASGTMVVTCALALMGMGLFAALQWAASPGEKSAKRARRGVANYAAAAGVISVVALAVFYRSISYPTHGWYYVGMLSFVFVCAEVSVASAMSGRPARIALVAIAVVVMGAGALPAWRALHAPHTNVDVVAGTLNEQTGRDDLILVNPWVIASSLGHYYTGQARIVTIPPIEDYRVHRYDLIKDAMLSDDPLAPLRAQIQQTLESGHRLWVVGGLKLDRSGVAPAPMPKPPLPDSLWNAAPYDKNWNEQIGAFVGAHVTSGQVMTPAMHGGRYESVDLAVLSGWK